MNTSLTGKTVFITGGSRGIGKAIALRLAREGANIAIAAKTIEPHPKLEGTIYSVAAEIEAVGAKALPLQVDIRDEEGVKKAVAQTVETFGGIDILINNASAINLTPAESIEPKRFDLMQGINVRGTFFTCQACIPHLRKSSNGHILNLSPPLNLASKWFASHLAYTISKYGIGVNALWPRTTIATAAVQNLLGGDFIVQRSRKPLIVADAAYAVLKKNAAECTGNFFFDEDVLREEGVTDFTPYAMNPEQPLMPDIFID